MVKGTAGQEFLLTVIRTLLYPSSCESQVKAQPSSGHIFHARSCVRRDNPSDVIRDCILLHQKWSHVLQVGFGEIHFRHQAMPNDVDDIQILHIT